MIERDMEDLIAEYPQDFFRRKNFSLRGRQQSFANIGRFDLLFEDEFETMILMELKARPIKYEDASQVARYRDELKRNGAKNVIMWLVGPQIPSSVREFLDDKGIEYSEIHFSEFRQVAERHGFVIKSEQPKSSQDEEKIPNLPSAQNVSVSSSRRPQISSIDMGPTVTTPSGLIWKVMRYDLALESPDQLDRIAFEQLVSQFDSAVPSRKHASLIAALREWAAERGSYLSA